MKAQAGDGFGARSGISNADALPHIAIGTRALGGATTLYIGGGNAASEVLMPCYDSRCKARNAQEPQTAMGTAQDLIRRHQLSVSDYHRMGDAGIFAVDARVELIEGEIVDMSPIGSKHASTVYRMTEVLRAACGRQAFVWSQNPIVLPEHSEPEPDIALLRPRDDFYAESHPQAKDVLLIVEVADTTLRYDREVKIPLYAKHGIPEVWLVDVENKRLTVFHTPDDNGYRHEHKPQSLGVLSLREMSGVAVDLSSLL